MTETDDTDLEALYRASARETPSAAMDARVLGAAQSHLRRRRLVPFVALAASLVVAVLLVRAWAPPTPGAAPDETRAYLMQLDTAPADPAAGPEAG